MHRAIVRGAGGMQREMRTGEIGTQNPGSPVIIATDAAVTLAAASLAKAGGFVQYSSFSAGRVITTDTAANLIAQFFANGDIGDSVVFCISSKAAFAGTWGAGVGVTLAGRATTPASSYSLVVMTLLSATTVEWFVM